MIRHAIILAAGRGQRMTPLTNHIPKPLAPYKDSTLIANVIDQLSKRVQYIHVTVGYKKSLLAPYVLERGVSSVFDTEGKSNCWWVYNTPLKYLDEPVYVVTCDNIAVIDFDLLERNHLELNAPPCLLMPAHPVVGIAGDYISHRRQIVTAIDPQRETNIYCSGIQILNPCKVNHLTTEGDGFYSLWRQLIKQKLLLVSSVYPEPWFSVDTLEQLQRCATDNHKAEQKA